ncbi:MAG: dual specificity protein phosphatase family protein [Sumerlaeia bacterium]
MIVFKFLLICAMAAWAAWEVDGWVARLLLCWSAFAFFWLALAYAARRPGWLFKDPASGRLRWPSWLLLGPYHTLNFVLMETVVRFSRENPCDEIVPGLWLGRRLVARDRAMACERDWAAVLDCTAEFREPDFLHPGDGLRYLNLRILDTGAPTAGDIEAAVRFLCERQQSGPLYVHCAAGHGRSATLVAAYLMRRGLAATMEDAEALIREKRPGARLHGNQRRALRAWAGGG